jgi:hypothetical protein
MDHGREDRGEPAWTEESQGGEDARTQADADGIAADLLQTLDDAEQLAVDDDQQASDNDQALAYREQRYADQDQAAADAEHVHARLTGAARTLLESRGAREATRRGRAATESTRSRTTADRMIRATLRDAISRLRNLTPAGRERSAAEARDDETMP